MNTRLKAVARLRTVKGAIGERPKVNLEDIASHQGKVVAELHRAPAGELCAFEPGDVLFSKLRPYLAKSLRVEKPLFGTSELLCMVPGPLLDAGFLAYLALSRPWLEWAVATSYGTKMPRTSWEAVANFRLRLLPMAEQRRIVDFLNDQVTLLDRAIALRQQQISQVDPRFWAWFLGRLEACDAAALPLRRMLPFVADGPFGSAFSSADYVADGPVAVRLGNIGFADYKSADQARVPEAIWHAFPRCHVLPGDLLIASLGDPKNHAGRACMAPADLGPALVKGKSLCARPDQRCADAHFLALMLSSPLGAGLFAVETRGATRAMINIEIVKSVRFPMPPRAQQVAIAAEAREQRVHGEGLTGLAQTALNLLQERKQALITAAVTGQFDVTTARKVEV